METVTTKFLTYHLSGNDMHIRTESPHILFVSQDQEELLNKVKTLRRGQKIKVTGDFEHSKTLSKSVLHAKTIDSL